MVAKQLSSETTQRAPIDDTSELKNRVATGTVHAVKTAISACQPYEAVRFRTPSQVILAGQHSLEEARSRDAKMVDDAWSSNNNVATAHAVPALSAFRAFAAERKSMGACVLSLDVKRLYLNSRAEISQLLV